MKTLKCPICHETSTFTGQFHSTIYSLVPFELNANGDEVEANFDKEDKEDGVADINLVCVICNECGREIKEKEIEIVEI